ncbi:sugar transferase [Aquirufa sp. ROCK-SH2]
MKHIVKILFDYTFAFFGLIILSPILLMIGLLIKISEPNSPILFTQLRVGQYGQLFMMYKFRTMVLEHDGNSISIFGDDRVTSIGKILRKYKLDELPELWNILIGEMSFVGPRPDVPGYADNLIGEQRNILKMKPGLTGPATLKYKNEEKLLARMSNPKAYNDEVIFPDKVRINLQYFYENNLLMDLKIILSTIFGVHIFKSTSSNILITSAGQRVSLVRIFKETLNAKGIKSLVYTTDLQPTLSPACEISDQSFQVISVLEKNYVEQLIEICTKNKIGIIVPTIDTELLILSQSLGIFAKNGIQVVISENALIESCRNKKRTNALFDHLDIQYPKHFEKKSVEFPLFIKPISGSLSQNLFVFKNSKDFKSTDFSEEEYLFMEYFDKSLYQEFTIDAYYDKSHKLVMAVPRERIQVRAGEINKGVTRKNEVLDWIKNKLFYLEGAKGCLTIQVFLNLETREIYGIEINPRFGGGYPLSFHAGANFAAFIIDEYFENKSLTYTENWDENTLMLRYDDEIIVKDYHG